MIESKFASTKGVDGFLLDGFPRTIAQAEALDAMLAKTSESVTACVSIMIPDAMIHERIAKRALIEGRADDAKDDVVQNRIKELGEAVVDGGVLDAELLHPGVGHVEDIVPLALPGDDFRSAVWPHVDAALEVRHLAEVKVGVEAALLPLLGYLVYGLALVLLHSWAQIGNLDVLPAKAQHLQ